MAFKPTRFRGLRNAADYSIFKRRSIPSFEDFLKEKIPEEFKNEEDLYIDIKYETYEKKRMERISRALEVFY